ncbi:MAG: tetratricopeptide repeat protein [Proteobacteria bacterium]|nr:tetratricopeptide repeat protein [Pseudomonadota bacterium]
MQRANDTLIHGLGGCRGVALASLLTLGVGCAGQQQAPTAVGAPKAAPSQQAAGPASAGAGGAPGVLSEGASAATVATPQQAKPTEQLEAALAAEKRGAHEEAIEHCKTALRRDEKYTPAMEVMARAYFRLGKREFAESICEIAINLEPRSARCHNLRGLIALRDDDQSRALAQFQKATQADEGYGPAWLNLGAQYLEVKNYKEAVAALERAVARLPQRPEAHLNLGAAYRGAAELVKAVQALSRALALQPDYAAAYFNLGVLYLDAESFPGMERRAQLQAAIVNLGKFKRLEASREQAEVAEGYLQSAQRELEKEGRRIERAQAAKAREAAKAAAKAAAAKADAAKAADKPAAAQAAPEKPAAPAAGQAAPKQSGSEQSGSEQSGSAAAAAAAPSGAAAPAAPGSAGAAKP